MIHKNSIQRLVEKWGFFEKKLYLHNSKNSIIFTKKSLIKKTTHKNSIQGKTKIVKFF